MSDPTDPTVAQDGHVEVHQQSDADALELRPAAALRPHLLASYLPRFPAENLSPSHLTTERTAPILHRAKTTLRSDQNSPCQGTSS